MIETPAIVETQAQITAMIPVKVARDKIQEVMGPGIQELLAAIAAQGIHPVGPFFTHHLKITPEFFDFELCFPVSAPVQASGRMQPSVWPAMKVARTVYCGPYEGLGEAWGEFHDWIDAQALTPATDLWECYLSGPESSSDPAEWRTQLNRPLLD